MIRTFHGCEIESLPAQWAADRNGVQCDGYDHTVRKQGDTLGTFPTLAEAIASAKTDHGPYTYQPVVEE